MFSPSRRTLIVLATLLGSMTLASAMLLVLAALAAATFMKLPVAMSIGPALSGAKSISC